MMLWLQMSLYGAAVLSGAAALLFAAVFGVGVGQDDKPGTLWFEAWGMIGLFVLGVVLSVIAGAVA